MSSAVAKIEHIRGETITWGLRADPDYDGTETVTCDVKRSVVVPADSAPVVMSPSVVFVAASGDDRAHWLFTITAAQSAILEPGSYVTDAKTVFAGGSVDYPRPLRIEINGRVTK